MLGCIRPVGRRIGGRTADRRLVVGLRNAGRSDGSAQLGSAQLSSARLDSAWLGLNQLRELRSALIGATRICSNALQNHSQKPFSKSPSHRTYRLFSKQKKRFFSKKHDFVRFTTLQRIRGAEKRRSRKGQIAARL